MLNVGEYIKILRIQKGMTQEELGKLIGVKRAAVQKWECGRVQNLKRTTIQKLSSIFEVDPSSFIAEHKITTAFSEDALSLVAKYEKLNKSGKSKTHDYIDDLLDNDKYIAPIKQTIAAHGADETEGTNQPPIQETIL